MKRRKEEGGRGRKEGRRKRKEGRKEEEETEPVSHIVESSVRRRTVTPDMCNVLITRLTRSSEIVYTAISAVFLTKNNAREKKLTTIEQK
jgi:hypothetical protein